MIRSSIAFLLVAGLALLAGPVAQAQDKITSIDRYKSEKEKKTATAVTTGTITEENASRILVKGVIGSIAAGDVVDITYNVPAASKLVYRAAESAEKRVSDPATKGADRKKALQEAMDGYKKLQGDPTLKSNKFLQRHLQYKIARLTARMAADDKAKRKSATEMLLKFKADHPNSWQLTGCLEKLADLQQESGDFKGAAETFDDMAKMKELSPETRKKCQLAAAQALVQAGDAKGAEDRLNAVLKTIKKDEPQYFRLQMTLAQCQASQKDQVVKAIDNLNKIVSGLKGDDQLRKAIALNTLGDCYLADNRPKDALYAYLNVDQYYNADRDEHRKACAQLVKLYEKLRDKQRVKEFQEKLAQLKN